MAPPRRGAVVDDSRSEASSGPRESKGKARRTANGVITSREAKGSSNPAGVTSAPPIQGENPDQAKVPWCDMPLEILHSYRHAYKLNTPSAFSTDYSSLLLSSGIGLRSPTSLAARRNQIYRSQHAHEVNGPSAENSFPNAVDGKTPHADQSGPPYAVNEKSLHKVVGQGRVNKNQLVQAVRKHFNNAGLGEQDAITRFLYKVHEESRGHQFRLRFQS